MLHAPKRGAALRVQRRAASSSPPPPPPPNSESHESVDFYEQKKKQEAAFARLQQIRMDERLAVPMENVSSLHGRSLKAHQYDYTSLQENIYDFVIVGSGYAGSIFALRMSQKGYSVLVVEEGARWEGDGALDNRDITRTTWKPRFNLWGMQKRVTVGPLDVTTGVGIGGSSLTQDAALEHPELETFDAGVWAGFTSAEEMQRFYALSEKMLGVVEQPFLTEPDCLLREGAEELGLNGTMSFAKTNVFFGKQKNTAIKDTSPEERRIKDFERDHERQVPAMSDSYMAHRIKKSTSRQMIQRKALGTDGEIAERGRAVWTDPYFNGVGPNRGPCIGCAKCSILCRTNAKNTMEVNYGFLAERRYDATFMSTTRAEAVRYLGKPTEEDDSRYVVDVVHRTPQKGLFSKYSKGQSLRLKARNVVMAAGTLGTNQLLLKMRGDELGLPKLPEIGVGLNSPQTATFLVSPLDDTDEGEDGLRDFSNGVTTTSVLRLPAAPLETHTVEVRHFGRLCIATRRSFIPHVEGETSKDRFIALIKKFAASGFETFRWLTRGGWEKSCFELREKQAPQTLFTVGLDKNSALTVVGSEASVSKGAQSVGLGIAGRIVDKLGGGWVCRPFAEILRERERTDDIVGGVPLGTALDSSNQFAQYPGLFVVDSACIPAPLQGYTSTLTVCALAERAASKVPDHPEGASQAKLLDKIPWATVDSRSKGEDFSDSAIRA